MTRGLLKCPQLVACAAHAAEDREFLCTFATMSKNILIAESGSTKTDWVLIGEKRNRRFSTQGLHPYLQGANEIIYILENELKLNPKRTKVDEIYFYGAGVNSKDSKKVILKALKSFFDTKKIYTEGDLLAAARATCQNEKGIACILGTGSNSCFYNGKRITTKLPSLGYVLGDNGSGNHIGRKLLQYYFQGIMDKELASKFEKMFDVELETILNNIYRKQFPNRYLARFAKFALENRGHFMIENIAEDCINDFFINNLLHYKQVHNVPVHFSGSVANSFKDIIQQLCFQYEIELGKVVKRPIGDLLKFHKA